MPYAPAALVLSAVDALDGAYPFAVVTFPALLRAARVAGRDPVTEGVEFGSSDESALLEEYFVLPRPPEPDRPYRAPWSSKAAWQKKKYPGGGLQRLRTDWNGRGRVLLQEKSASAGTRRDIWRITADAGHILTTEAGQSQVRLVDLALWFGRDLDVGNLGAEVTAGLDDSAEDIDRLLAWFRHEFRADTGDLVGTLYSADIPDDYRQHPFESEPIGEDTLEVLGSLPPAPTVGMGLPELVSQLEVRLVTGGYQLPPGLVRRVLTAWLRGDLVILVGQPGTGKTLFATLLGLAMSDVLGLDTPITVAVRADFDETEFIGYERLDGTPELRQFAQEVLMTENPLEARVVVLEEFNLAAIETYLASVLVATQEQTRQVQLPGGTLGKLPVDTFVLATCNSYRDEPETRTRVSSPTKRRSTIVTMPNVLGDRFDEDPDNAVLSLVENLVAVEAARVDSRRAQSRPSQFDSLRGAALGTVTTLADISDHAKDMLVAVSGALLRTSAGRSWFTMGLLRDVVLSIAHAERDADAELLALGEAVADKLIHQVRGTHADIEELREVCAQLPNAAEIASMIDRMMDGPSDELLPLL
ncbi:MULTISPECIES: AAA family ATPase [Rhodococcus]|uniref:AAA+ ATPase domain-containing protein n=1 Tax=Rhodococcus opacus RKJ300 = JCM 13270 TaxID=1165867 RepID=I0WM03_RHOOP|nr:MULTISPECIES: AAA family ATPase [Rhodococcus]EID77419.1 hypothetical protein W59_23755 [Rhodococcus opacus RKJ300 = JCM 13270]QQZ18426.1 AAA family ATPase [Rhodococcus sp. 21391]